MTVYNFDKNMTSADIATELIFRIATSRADGENLLRFNFLAESSERMLKAACKELKALKRRGAIQLFATAEDFDCRATEAEFLLNKFPTLNELSENNFVLVKL